MAPPHRSEARPDAFALDAWAGRDEMHVSYEFEFDNGTKTPDIIKPGTVIKIKNLRSTFKFRCYVHNVETDTTWIDCIDTMTGEWRSFRIEKIKGVVKPKKSRRKKPNV